MLGLSHERLGRRVAAVALPVVVTPTRDPVCDPLFSSSRLTDSRQDKKRSRLRQYPYKW